MPKKISTNPKALEARARKEEAKKSEHEKKEREKEDELWRDDDKQLQRKAERKAAEEKKRQQQLENKQLKQALYEQEMGPEKKQTEVVRKMTRAEIEREMERKRAEELKKKNIEVQRQEADLLTENVNHLTIEGEVGRTVDEAIAILSNASEAELDKHPERRLKAAYAAFEEQQLPIVKAENPNLRLSQLKQMIRKDWNKSPENPLNRPHAVIGKR